MINHHHQNQVGEERIYFILQFSGDTLSQKDIRAITQGRNWSRCHRGTWLTDLLHMTCSACFLTCPKTTWPGVAPLMMGWALPNQLTQYKIDPLAFLQVNLVEGFSQSSSLFSDNSVLSWQKQTSIVTKLHWVEPFFCSVIYYYNWGWKNIWSHFAPHKNLLVWGMTTQLNLICYQSLLA